MSLTVDIQKQIGNFSLRAAFRAENEVLGILGTSGSGKSTTLRCIAGILNPDAGRIVLNGRTVFDSEAHIRMPVQARRIGYLFQQYALFPNMTVEQNIAAGITDCKGSERREKLEDLLERFRLTEKRKQRPATLSGGEQQRTALARILAGKPELLLLDEPFSAMDAYLGDQLMWELAKVLKDFQGTVLFVSHNKEEISRFCEHVVVLDNGTTEPVQTVRELLYRPSTEADAMLAGFHNIVKALPGGPGKLQIPAWGIAVAARDPGFPVEAVCVPDDAFHVSRAPKANDISCTIAGSASISGKNILLLRPDAAERDTYIRMETNVCDVETKERIWLSVTENRVLFLRKNEK